MAISQIIPAGDLDRRIKVLGLTATKERGEVNNEWALIFSTWAKREDLSGSVTDKAGADTAVFNVQFTIRYNTNFLSEVKKYEALRIMDRAWSPVYLRDDDGNVFYTLAGHPMLSLKSGDLETTHKLLHFKELGRKIGMQITCEGWR